MLWWLVSSWLLLLVWFLVGSLLVAWWVRGLVGRSLIVLLLLWAGRWGVWASASDAILIQPLAVA